VIVVDCLLWPALPGLLDCYESNEERYKKIKKIEEEIKNID